MIAAWRGFSSPAAQTAWAEQQRQALIQESHQVVLHARSPEPAATLGDLAPRSAGVVIGDLSSAIDTPHVANLVNALGRMDAVIHNARRVFDDRSVTDA